LDVQRPSTGFDLDTQVMLEELARLDGSTVPAALARAVEERFIRRLNEVSSEEYAALRADPKAWRELQDERAEWDVTLADGIDEGG